MQISQCCNATKHLALVSLKQMSLNIIDWRVCERRVQALIIIVLGAASNLAFIPQQGEEVLIPGHSMC